MKLEIEHLLPIGSRVLLKGSQKKVMIIGFFVAMKKEDKKEVYDYLGCLWPEGVIDSDKNIVFNKEDIEEVITKGVEDDEETTFKQRLADALLVTTKMDVTNVEDSSNNGNEVL